MYPGEHLQRAGSSASGAEWGGQDSQEAAPAGETARSGQGRHSLAWKVAAKVPAGHSAHPPPAPGVDELVWVWGWTTTWLPGPHGAHTSEGPAPVGPKPSTQTHAAAPLPLTALAGQGLHSAWSSSAE